MEKEMSWLVKIDQDKFEVWSDKEYSMMKQKCEYYGAKPHWVEIRQLENPLTASQLNWELSPSLLAEKAFVIQ
jgi:hypothetical protein